MTQIDRRLRHEQMSGSQSSCDDVKTVQIETRAGLAFAALSVCLVTFFVCGSAAAFQERTSGGIVTAEPRFEITFEKPVDSWTYDAFDEALLSVEFDKAKNQTVIRKYKFDFSLFCVEDRIVLEGRFGAPVRKFDVYLAPKLDGSELAVIDWVRFKRIGSIDLDGLTCFQLDCATNANPYVYGICEDEERQFRLIQIDAGNFKVLGSKQLTDDTRADGFGEQLRRNMRVSPDGELIYIEPKIYTLDEQRFAIEPFLIGNQTVNVEGALDFHDDFIRYHHVTLYAKGGKNKLKSLARVDGSRMYVELHPTRDVYAELFVTKGNQAVIQLRKVSDKPYTFLQQENRTIDNPVKVLWTENLQFLPEANRAKTNLILLWHESDNLILADQNRIQIVEVSNTVREQDFRFDPISLENLQCQLGELARLDLTAQLTSGKNFDYQIISGPKSARIDNKRFVWTPNATDVGIQKFQINVKYPGEQKGKLLRFDIDVRRPHFIIDEDITTIKVSPNQKYIVGLGFPSRFDRKSKKDVLWQVYSATTGKLLQDLKPKRAAIDDFTVTNKYIFVHYRDDLQGERIDLENDFAVKSFDLPEDLVESAKIRGSKERWQNNLRLTKDGHIAITYRYYHPRLRQSTHGIRDVVDSDSLVPLTDRRLLTTSSTIGEHDFSNAYYPDNQILLGRRLIDLATKRVIQNHGDRWLPIMSHDEAIIKSVVPGRRGWRRDLTHYDASIRIAKRTERGQAGVDWCLGIAPMGEFVPERWLPVVTKHQYDDEKLWQRKSYRSKPPRICEAGDTLFCHIADRIYAVKIPSELVEPIRLPLDVRLSSNQASNIVFNTDKKIELALETSQNPKSVTYKYVGQSNDVEFCNGSVAVVDAPKILEKYLKGCSEKEISVFGFAPTVFSQPKNALYFFDNPEFFEQMTGFEQPNDQFPFQFPLEIEAADAFGNKEKKTFLIILLAQKKAFEPFPIKIRDF